MATPHLRPATVADAEAINAIYNHYVQTSAATFQVEDETTAERVGDLERRAAEHPCIVLEVDGEIAGWGTLSPFHSRCAYRETGELSAYVRPDRHRRGYGRIIVRDLMGRARSLGYHTIVAVSCEESVGMIHLLKSSGFAEAGRLRQVGSKFDRRLDVIYLQWVFEADAGDRAGAILLEGNE